MAKDNAQKTLNILHAGSFRELIEKVNQLGIQKDDILYLSDQRAVEGHISLLYYI